MCIPNSGWQCLETHGPLENVTPSFREDRFLCYFQLSAWCFTLQGTLQGSWRWHRRHTLKAHGTSKLSWSLTSSFSLEKLQRAPFQERRRSSNHPFFIRGELFWTSGVDFFMNHISSPADTSKKFLLHYYDQPLHHHTFHCYHHFHHVILDSLWSMGRMLCSYAMLAEQGVPRQGSSSWKMAWQGWFLRCISDLGCHEKVRVNR